MRFQGAHHGVLPDEVGERLGPVFAREDLVLWGVGFGHLVKLREGPSRVHLQ